MERFYTVKEAAEAYSLSEKTLKDWLRAGKVKGEKLGRSWRIAESDIRQYLKLSPLSTDEKPINKRYVQAELEKLQQLLLDINEGRKEGMEKSEALKLIANLEEIVEELEGVKFSRHERCTGGGARFTREHLEHQTNSDAEEEIEERINDIVCRLIVYGDDEVGAVEYAQDIERIIRKNFNESITPRVERDLKELNKSAQEFDEKDKQGKTTMADAYRLGACFRRIGEYVDAGLLVTGGAKFTRTRPI